MVERDARRQQLNSVGHNHSRDSAIDADLQEWETETLEIELVSHCTGRVSELACHCAGHVSELVSRFTGCVSELAHHCAGHVSELACHCTEHCQNW